MSDWFGMCQLGSMEGQLAAGGAHHHILYSPPSTVVWPYDGGNEHHLTLNLGELVRLEEHSSGWYKGKALHRPERGVFPASHVHIKRLEV